MQNAITKSTTSARAAPSGSRIRGKYTFSTRLVLLTMLSDDWLSAWENIIQGTSAVYVSSAYGAPDDGTFARWLRKSVKMPISISGCSSAQNAPIDVCL